MLFPFQYFSGVSCDSRKILPRGIFVAINGYQRNGFDYIEDAISRGAIIVLYDTSNYNNVLQLRSNYIVDKSYEIIKKIGSDVSFEIKNSKCNNLQESFANEIRNILDNYENNIYPKAILIRTECLMEFLAFASRHYNSKQPNFMVAVTGTDGKTSICNIAQQVFREMADFWNGESICIGSLGVKTVSYVKGNLTESSFPLKSALTTPNSEEFFEILNEFHYLSNCFFEATSIGLDQHRIDFANIQIGVFSNFHEDHIDIHKTYENYFNAKLRLFGELINSNGVAIINDSIPHLEKIKDVCSARNIKIIKYGVRDDSDVQLVSTTRRGEILEVEFNIFGMRICTTSKIFAQFQMLNLCAVICIAIAKLQMNEYSISLADFVKKIAEIIPNINSVYGRLSKIDGHDVFVDSGHTPNAMLTTLRDLRMTYDKIILVFGCGGDRDKHKRRRMAEIAKTYADFVIVTDDNPRNEPAHLIRSELLSASSSFIEVSNRRYAISLAIQLMAWINNFTFLTPLLKEKMLIKNTGKFCVLIAGKGHEKEQIILEDRIPFSDFDAVKNALNELNNV
ncbi:Mur ligase family protein [Candidatus Gromoviella agglomerans]|uniref:Mur ligase family protein n=1 Tax=Candidatus Gromoviella agglomerans TaxID=2806609 RepID=UPI001E30471A|nr:Mur ligase family protein [Candidatus Gromoviella agglomerans]